GRSSRASSPTNRSPNSSPCRPTICSPERHGARRASAPPRPCSVARERSAPGQRVPGLGDDRLERVALVHREIGEHLAVELDAGALQPVHELRIGEALGADAGIDALDPQAAKAALLHLAVAIGILAGLLDRLAGDADRVLATAVIALRLIQNALVLGARGRAALDACHRSEPPYFRP